MKRLVLGVLVASVMACACLGGSMPFVGVWKLNHEKSHFSHGELPKSLVLTIEADGADGIRYGSKNLIGDKTGGITYSAKLDGTDAPVKHSSAYDFASVRRIDARTLKIQLKKEGAVVVDTIYQVSADGKSLTRKGTANKAPGETNKFEESFDRQ